MSKHDGERAVQLRAGWTRDNWGSAGVRPEIPTIGGEFLRQQQMLAIGAVDEHTAAWATVLTGPQGFVDVADERTVVIAGQPGRDDPLAGPLVGETDVGMLAIEPHSRRRMRINGRSRSDPAGVVVRTDQVYANCPKYIQARQLLPDTDWSATPGPARSTKSMTAQQQRWITAADTFFVATHAPGHGTDVSHRGGNPGFVTVLEPRRLAWPDYVGNSMYMTLGNLERAPACGLLFLDWTRGHALHLTGRARTDWDPRRASLIPGALRVIEFEVDRVVQIDRASPLHWTPGERFRHNPPIRTSIAEEAHP
jgi:predicted pyridoxine 5'-phosphate oxidase superfamily flavin-nucleotide-binding protein